MSNFRYYRPDGFPPVVKNLLIINALIYVAQITIGMEYYLTERIALHPIDSPLFRPYQVITHMFAHAPGIIFHILFNMFALWMFGRILENVWGPKRFIIFYLTCGLGAAAAHLLVQHLTGNYGYAVGASGAVMGLFAAFGYLFPNTELYLMFIPVPIKAKWAVIGFVTLDILLGVLSIQGDNVARFAHIGGAITGFILVLIWNKTNKRRFY